MSWFFIGGSQRSGTTMLQILLCQDPAVNPMIQEAKYVRQLAWAYKIGLIQFDIETRDYFSDLETFDAFNARILRDVLERTLAQFPGAKHLVLREPHMSMVFPEFARLLEDARFILLVRDPRDIVASMIGVGKKLKQEAGPDESMVRLFTSRDMAAIGRHILSFYLPSLTIGRPEFRNKMLILRYEDLVQKTEQAIAQLRAFTGIELKDYDPTAPPNTGRIDYSRISGYKKAWASDGYAKPIADTSIGRYREVLTDGEIEKLSAACADYMRMFNYT